MTGEEETEEDGEGADHVLIGAFVFIGLVAVLLTWAILYLK